jgi:hypothetical protein
MGVSLERIIGSAVVAQLIGLFPDATVPADCSR